MYRNRTRSLDLAMRAADKHEFDLLVNALELMVQDINARMAADVDGAYIRRLWARADKDESGTLSQVDNARFSSRRAPHPAPCDPLAPDALCHSLIPTDLPRHSPLGGDPLVGIVAQHRVLSQVHLGAVPRSGSE